MPAFEPADFHKRYYKVLTDFADGKIRKLMVFMPPKHGKSEGSKRRLPAFILGDNPDKKVAIVCKTKDETKVEWAFNGINKPLGVAAYELNNIIPKEIVSKLPTIEEVEQGLNKVDVPDRSSKK